MKLLKKVISVFASVSLLTVQACSMNTVRLSPKVLKYSVGIITHFKGSEGGSLGSGTIISSDGYILTCAHLFGHGKISDITVVTWSGDETDGISVKATLVMRDSDMDIAILKLEGPNRHLRYAKLANSDKVKRGDEVLIVGFPMGLSLTVTYGIVSGLHRGFRNLIQSDAVANPGNSGGGVFNSKGQLIGLTEALTGVLPLPMWSGQTLIIPVNNAKELIEDFTSIKL